MNFIHTSKLNIFTLVAVFTFAFFAFGTSIVKAAPPTVVITASPGTVASGSASTLTWNTTDATSCTASGNWSGSKAVNGTESTGALTVGSTYTLTCTGPEGTASAFTFVTIGVPPTPAPTVVITASPGTVTSGSASTLTWNSTDATSCTASGDWSGSKAVNGTESTGALTTGKTYNISCTGAGGTATAFTFVTVTASPTPPTVVITASPGTVTSGSASTLTWNSTNATACTASTDWSGSKAVNGTESTGSLTSNKTYTITCTGPGGTATAFTFVTVTSTPVPGANLSVTKTANRTSGNVGESVVYTIVVTNNGADQATNVVANDMIPAGIDFVSSNTTSGSYNSSTGVWTIGTLNNGSSATLTITGNIRTGFQGQTIINTVNVSATQTDPNPGNNTASVNITVNVPGCTSNCGGGGGGGILPTSDLSVSKTANRTTAVAGDIIVYTITITNSGPFHANDVTAVDKLPSSVTFLAATTTSGNYTYGNGMWFAGSLNTGSSTTLTISARVNAGHQGQVIRNSVNVYAAQTDQNPGNNTAYVDVNAGTTVTPPTTCYYLLDYLRKDFNNNPVEVRKLQIFLRDLEGFTSVQITGVYDDQTIVALNAFQARYASDILTPWGHTAPTSYTYILTKKKVNEIYCKMAFPVTPLQQIEIDNYRAFLLSLKNSGIQFPSTGNEPAPVVVPAGTTTPPVLYGEVGVSTTTPQGTLSRFTANVLDAVGNLFNSLCHVLNWLLLLVIIIISYLWYRDRENARKIAELNKDLSLK